MRGMFAGRPNQSQADEHCPLFDEYERDYGRPALRAETTYSFYNRSALDEFEKLRAMLQRWVNRMPPAKQRDLVGRMRHKGDGSIGEQRRFDGAFFELFLHEFLVGTGGHVVVEPNIDGGTPDFGVTEILENGTMINYLVEASHTNVLANAGLESDWLENRALDILDEIDSPDFYLWVDTEGTLERTPSKAELKKPFERLVREADYDLVRAAVELYGPRSTAVPTESLNIGAWTISGQLIPVAPERRPKKGRFVGVAGPSSAVIYDETKSIQNRILEKARQYKNADNLIVAIGGSPWIGYELQALLRRDNITRENAGDSDHDRDFAFTHSPLSSYRSNATEPIPSNVIGIAVFSDILPHCIDRSTVMFYPNPNTDKPLPTWSTKVSHTTNLDGALSITRGAPVCDFMMDYEPRPENIRWYY